MPLVKRFEDVKAWQQARKLTRTIYALTDGPAFRCDFGLVDQVRRAAVSVMNNVAEGFESGSPAEFTHFLGYAKRSGSEVQSCLYIALDCGYCSQTQFQEAYKEVEQARGLITGFIRYLRNARVNGKAKALTQAPSNTGT